jgi:hypothetical protein
VFPLTSRHKRPRAALTEWEHQATTDPGRVERWWRRHPHDNVGIACGPSGLVVVDLDRPKPGEAPPEDWPGAAGGADVLERLARRHNQVLAPTWTVETPSGGRHLYFHEPARGELRNTQGRMGWHIDTRGAGGYIVAAGSIVDHRPYTVVDHNEPIELPGWMTQLLQPPPPPPKTAGRAGRLELGDRRRRGRYVQAAIDAEVQRVLDAGPGVRNHALNLAAWNLGRLVTEGLVDRATVEDALQTAGEVAGYADGPRAVAAVIRSALDARRRHPT